MSLRIPLTLLFILSLFAPACADWKYVGQNENYCDLYYDPDSVEDHQVYFRIWTLLIFPQATSNGMVTIKAQVDLHTASPKMRTFRAITSYDDGSVRDLYSEEAEPPEWSTIEPDSCLYITWEECSKLKRARAGP